MSSRRQSAAAALSATSPYPTPPAQLSSITSSSQEFNSPLTPRSGGSKPLYDTLYTERDMLREHVTMLHDQNNSLKRELAENVNELRLTVQKIEQRESRCSELFIRFEEEILKLKAENSNLIEERRNNTSVKSADNWKRLKAEKSMQDLDIRLHAFESEFRLIEQTLAKASQASQLKRYQQLQQHQRNDSTSSENSASGGGGDGGFDSENENLLKRTSELYQAPMTEDRISSISYGVQLLLEERLKAEANLEVVMDKLKRLESGMSLRSSVSQPSPRCESAVTSSDAMAKINKMNSEMLQLKERMEQRNKKLTL